MERKGKIEEGEAPMLLISHGSADYENQSLYNVLENRCYNTSNIPMLESYRVVGSTHGWLVLVKMYSENCCLWNPKSMEEIELPPLKNGHEYNTCVLSKAPTEADCHIMLNLDTKNEQAYCKIGDDAFTTQTLEWGDEIEMLHAVRSFKGRIYGFVGVRRYGLASIDFVGADRVELRRILEFGDTLDVSPRPWGSTSYDDYLVESCDEDELLLVRRMQPVMSMGYCCEFRVFRVDPERMECVEVENIGDRTLFVSKNGDGFCCSSSLNKTKPNTIYYTGDSARSLYIYNLDDGSTTSLLPSPAVHHRSHAIAFWVQHQPSHHLLLNYFN